MSYDIRLGVKVEGLDVIAVIDEPEYSSPTYNLGKMFRACMGWNFEQGKWYNVAEVWPNIKHGIAELITHPGRYTKYNDPSGWGTVESAKEDLISLDECIKNNVGDSSWGTWQEIPPEHLWVRW